MVLRSYSLSDLVSRPLMMAMLSSLFLGSLWGEVMTTRFEFKPALTPYTVLCKRQSVRDLKWMASVCRDQAQTTAAAVLPAGEIASEVR